jgi:uncharacterized protein
MNNTIIEEIMQLVEKACKSEKNKFGYGIWTNHVFPMIKIGEELGKEYNGDIEIIKIAIILHDLAGIEGNQKEHHIIGAKRAEEILKKYNYPHEKIEKIKLCILNHRSSVPNKKNSIEEIIVADADAIIHLTQISSLFYAAYKEMDMTIEEGHKWVYEKIKKDYIKLSSISKEKYENEFKTIIKILE